MSRFKLNSFIVAIIVVLLLAFPSALFRDLSLLRNGKRIDLTERDFSETKTYDLELTWKKRFWQGSAIEIWVDDCLRSIVVNGHDISEEFAYCDWLGSRRIDLSPYLTSGLTTLEIQVENLGGRGGLTISGVGNGFFTTYRYLLVFLLILIRLYRNGQTEDRARRAESRLEADEREDEGADPLPSSVPFQGRLATVLRTHRGVSFVLLAVIAGSYFVSIREHPPSPTPGAGQGVAKPEPAAGERERPNVTIPAFKTGVGAPSWAEDERLNPRTLIEGDEFLMGSPDGVAYNDEQPQHRVRVSRFWMQQHEVTNEEYRRFRPEHGFAHGQERFPVVSVTWHAALAYAEWLGGGLPTEAQWEFAARGTRGRKYPWGDDEPTCARANFNDCGWRPKAVASHPQGATPKGVEDLAGNVLEWCGDWYADRYPPGNQTDPRGPTSGSWRVLRGGSFVGGPGYLRAAYRGYYHPAFEGHDIGFRVVWCAAGGLD